VTVYTRLALGDAAPLRTISGAGTGLNTPGGLALDLAHNEIFVTNRGSSAQSITVYSRTASGNVAPVRTIAGPDTGLNSPGGVTLDLANDEIYVTSPVLDSVQVFARTASGNVRPEADAGRRRHEPPNAVARRARLRAQRALRDEFRRQFRHGLPANGVGQHGSFEDDRRRKDVDGQSPGPRPERSDRRARDRQLRNHQQRLSDHVRADGEWKRDAPSVSLGEATFLHNLQDLDVTNAIPTGFTPVTPCRVVDTRRAAGPLGGPALNPFADRIFTIAGQCGIPEGARAVAFNFTITQPNRAGDLRVFPGAATPPIVSSLNWRPGETRANNAVLQLGADGEITTRVDEDGGSVHFVVDVTGYFH
jgi:hypothetical protein